MSGVALIIHSGRRDDFFDLQSRRSPVFGANAYLPGARDRRGHTASQDPRDYRRRIQRHV